MSLANLEEKVEFIFNELVRNKAALSELESCNILVKLKNDRAYDLDIIDGFGNSDFLKICDVSRFFLKRKLVRKFAKFCDQLQLSRVF